MNEDLIERIWKEAGEDAPIPRERLLASLTPRVERDARILHRYVWTYLAVQAATVVLASINLAGYRSNPVMLGAEIGALLAALAFAAFGVRIHGEIRQLEQLDTPLVELVQRRLAFYRSRAKAWTWLAALSLVAFTFALNTLIDNVDGHYPVNHPVVFVLVQIAMVLVLVTSWWLAHEPHVRELRAVLADLESQLLDRTESVDREQDRWRLARIALVVVLAASAVLGLWMAIRHGA